MLRRLIEISRPILWINAVGPAVIAMWLSGTLWNLQLLPALLWLSLPFNLLIYGINDVFDLDTDATNLRKGGLEGARIVPQERRSILIAVAVLNLPFAIAFPLIYSPGTLLWMAAYTAVFITYSTPPIRLKARPLLDSLANAAYAWPLIFGSLALGEAVNWWAAAGLMLWSMAKHSYDAIQDISQDRSAGLRTTAVAFGIRGTLIWSGILWLWSSIIFGLINIPLGAVNALIAGILIIKLWQKSSEQEANRLYRLSIAFPYIAGAVAGSQLCAAILLGMYS